MSKYNKKAKAICPHCKGDKKVLQYYYKEEGTNSNSAYEDCTECLGEGIVNMELTYTPITNNN